MQNEQMELMQRLRELEFAAVELNLFLDTHPENQEALRDFNRVACELAEVRQTYEQIRATMNFGVSTARSMAVDRRSIAVASGLLSS